jgi:hypothetical protein
MEIIKDITINTPLIQIFIVIGTFLIAFFTWRTTRYARKKAKEIKPQIPVIKYLEDNRFSLIITNSKSYNIVVFGIFFKKQIWKFIFGKPKETIWHYPWDKFGEKTVVEEQEEYHFEIPNYDTGATYKIYVATSAGLAQSILYERSDLIDRESDVGD